MSLSTKSDDDLIEGAYQDQVGLLFKQFFISLTGEKGIKNDGKWLAAFTLGLNTLKRAKGLAIGVVGSSDPATTVAADARSSAQRALIAMTSDAAVLRIPTKPAMHSNVKPATCSDPKPAGVPI